MSFNYDGDSIYAILHDNLPQKERLRRMNQEIWSFFIEKLSKNGFQEREGQQDMALDIGQAIESQRHLIVEAGVGIGKSFAYIVPLFYFKKQFRRPVIISTSTITLQEQLQSDIRTISDILHTPMQSIIAKGQSHFICRRKVDSLNDKELKAAVIKAMNQQAVERCDLLALCLSDEQWDSIAISGFGKKYCKECTLQKQCFFQTMRNQLNKASNDIIVCNHDLLVADLRKRNLGRVPILSDAPIVIIDEAHNLENAARNQLTIQCSLSDYEWAISTVRSGVNQFDSLESTAVRIHDLMEKLYMLLYRQVRQQFDENHGASENSRYFYRPNEETRSLIRQIKKSLTKLADSVQIRLKGKASQAHESASDRLVDIAELFTNAADSVDSAIWLESDAREMRKLRLTLCPRNISGWLHDSLFTHDKTVVLTSATLTSQRTGDTEDMYRYIAGNIGFPSQSGDFSEPKESPFDYDHHTLMYCADDLPHPSHDKSAFITAACDRIVDLLCISHGSALILFTAKADLDAVHRSLMDRHLPYQIIRPVGGASQADTLDAFRLQPNSVLLGTGAFWEGINLAGDILTNVIIFKLPFPVPDPIITAKTDAAENGLMDVLVPEMVVKLKQGIGRLIRSEDDKGIISVLDPRLSESWHSPYRDVVFSSLPIKHRTSSVDEVRAFYTSKVMKE